MNTPFLNVTVPVDSSDTARRGVAYAIDMARGGARLHFCSVVDTAGACFGGVVGAPLDPGPLVDALEDDAERVCREAIAEAQKYGIAADGKVIYGSVAPAVGQYASEIHSDALVIGTHARHGLSRIVFGSVAESLLGISGVPVIVTHADDDAPASGPVTVAVDESPASQAALEIGIGLARARGESLSIVTVIEPGHDRWGQAEAILGDAAEAVRDAGIDFELVTVEGHAAEAIVAGARQRGSSMIVIGTNSRSGPARFVLGSVAAAVVGRARVPVAVVPQH